LFDVLTPEQRGRVGFKTSTTSFLQRMPGIAKRHRQYLWLMPLAVEQFDLSGYDLVISSSYAVAKGVLTGPDQLHLAYVHSPMRYAWDLQHQYLRESKMERGVKSVLARLLLHQMRLWDFRTANGVDGYIANSNFVARRIRKIYGKHAEVIYPPVRVRGTLSGVEKKRFFLTASRLVAYKNTHAIVEAFRALPDEQLIVVGTGPERARLEALAGPNVTFAGFVPDDALRRLMAEARAFVFAAEEDFGIVPIEAQAEGTPVIALGRGGALETIIGYGPTPTGLFFAEPKSDQIAAAVRRFLASADMFTPESCLRNAMRFSESRFDQEFRSAVETHLGAFRERLGIGRNAAGDVPQFPLSGLVESGMEDGSPVAGDLAPGDQIAHDLTGGARPPIFIVQEGSGTDR
jgi:glycosyltransferase involved in cell wall biosynthesis